MNILIEKTIPNLLRSFIDEQSNNDHKTNRTLLHQFKQWKHKPPPQVCIQIYTSTELAFYIIIVCLTVTYSYRVLLMVARELFLSRLGTVSIE